MRKKRLINFNMLGISGCGILILAMFVCLTPNLTMGNFASAEEVKVEAGVDLTANVRATVAISVEDEVGIDITPTADEAGVFNYGKSRMTVITNHMSGYSIYLRAQGSSNNLVPVRMPAGEETIAPVADGTIGTEFSGNTWGYNMGVANDSVDAQTLTYYAVPNIENKIIYTTETANVDRADTYDLTFGVNVDATLPSNTYANSVLVSAVANPKTLSSLYDIDYMQDMTSEICAETPVGFTKQLVDTRDGKKYWVAKLADENCWMTQNLALDLSTSKTLTSADTDITANWTPKSNTRIDNTSSTTKNSDGSYVLSPAFNGSNVNSNNNAFQYSWGTWKNTLVATPLRTRPCSTGGNSYSLKSNQQLFELCSGEGFVNVGTDNWSPTYQAQKDGTIWLTAGNDADKNASTGLASEVGLKAVEGSDAYEYTGLVAVKPNNLGDLSQGGEYDAHYLVGNYYQYNAATANTGMNIVNANASSSICPKGWRLPTSGDSTFDDKGSYPYMLRQYGLAKNASTGSLTGSVSGVNYNIAEALLYFARSGIVHTYVGYLTGAGVDGLYWSSSAGGSAAYAYYLNFTGSSLNPSKIGENHRYVGFPIRCIVR